MDDLTLLAYLTVTTEVRPRQVSQCGANTAGMRCVMYIARQRRSSYTVEHSAV